MKTEEYFIKTRNILKIFTGNHLGVLIVTTIYLLVLFLFSSSAYALNWNDKEWKDAGCPHSVIGLWKFDGSDNKEKTMRIEKGNVAIIAGNNFEENFLYETISLKVGDKFIELFLNSIDHVNKIYLKIRPHLISPIRKSLGDVNKNSYNCLIKVFQYSSPINAKFDKYSSWKIYKLNNTN